jgi:hypothetical protein
MFQAPNMKDFWAPTAVETEHNLLVVRYLNSKKKKLEASFVT